MMWVQAGEDPQPEYLILGALMGGALRAVCDLKTGTAEHGEVEPIFLNDQQLFGHLELNGHRWKLVFLLVVPNRDRAAQPYLNLPCHRDHSTFLVL